MKDFMPYPIQFVLVCGVFFLSCFVVLLSGSRLISVYISDFDFVVSSSHQECEEPYNNRCVRHYVVRQHATGMLEDLVPFGGQFPVSPLPDGMHILKRGHGFVYEIDGAQLEWQGLEVNYWLLIGGVLIVGLWFYLGGISFVVRSIRRTIERNDERMFFN